MFILVTAEICSPGGGEIIELNGRIIFEMILYAHWWLISGGSHSDLTKWYLSQEISADVRQSLLVLLLFVECLPARV